MSKQLHPPFDLTNVKVTCDAPDYRTADGSGLPGACIFRYEAQHRPALHSHPVDLRRLVWLNGSSASPILTLEGSATPEMLRDFAESLVGLADDLENQSRIINAASPFTGANVVIQPACTELETLRRAKVSEVLAEYDFGDVVISDHSGWTIDGNYWSSKVYGNVEGQEGNVCLNFGVEFCQDTATVVGTWSQPN